MWWGCTRGAPGSGPMRLPPMAVLGTAAAGVVSVKRVVSQPDDVHDEIVGSHPGMSGQPDMLEAAEAKGALETEVMAVADGP